MQSVSSRAGSTNMHDYTYDSRRLQPLIKQGLGKGTSLSHHLVHLAINVAAAVWISQAPLMLGHISDPACISGSAAVCVRVPEQCKLPGMSARAPIDAFIMLNTCCQAPEAAAELLSIRTTRGSDTSHGFAAGCVRGCTVCIRVSGRSHDGRTKRHSATIACRM